MKVEERHFFEFDEYRIEVEERRLTKNGEAVALNSRDFDILLALVERPGQTVDKDVLMDMVWGDTFVEEGNLSRHVSTLRRILGDDLRGQRFIKTIPKHLGNEVPTGDPKTRSNGRSHSIFNLAHHWHTKADFGQNRLNS